jgi:hypothetical protein
MQVAVSCSVVPLAMVEIGGVTAIDVKVASVTVIVAEPWTPLSVAKMAPDATPTPVTRPLVGGVSQT